MSRPQQVSSEDIIKVARKHFLSKGHSASLKEIAKDLGVSHSALIQRFGNKRELLLDALRPPVDLVWLPSFVTGPTAHLDTAIQELNQQCLLLSSFLQEHMPSLRVLQAAQVTPSELFGDQLPFPLLALKRLSTWIQKGIEQGLFRQCKAQTVASMIMGSIVARIQLSHLCMMTRECQSLPKIVSSEELLGSMNDLMHEIKQSLVPDSKNLARQDLEEQKVANVNIGAGDDE